MTHGLTRFIDTGGAGRDAGLAVLFGALAVLAMPPFFMVPVLLVSFPVLLRLLDKAPTGKRIFWITFLFHFAFHVAGLYWVAAALFVDIHNNWWAVPFALFTLPALMAAYPASALWVWHRFGFVGAARVILLAVAVAVSEWARGTVFTGFPWNMWGYAWVDTAPILQSVSYIGIYGLTFATVFLSFAPVLLWDKYRGRGLHLVVMVVAAALLVAGAWGYGRLKQPATEYAPPYWVRIVQPNIIQQAKWDETQRALNELNLWHLTTQRAANVPRLVVWPETSFALTDTASVRQFDAARDALLWDGAVLAAGLFEAEDDPKTEKTAFYNRIGFYDRGATRLEKFDKHHLVPFGEYLPFEHLWPVRPIAFQAGSMTAGPGVRTVMVHDMPAASPLICYEVIFSGRVTDAKNRPAFLLNVTNDAWYGDTTGPHQHLAIARVRAVEHGLPLVRAANTGISAMIDPMGRITAKQDLNTRGVVDASLPVPLPQTFFDRFGNASFAALLVLFAALGLALHAGGGRRYGLVA